MNTLKTLIEDKKKIDEEISKVEKEYCKEEINQSVQEGTCLCCKNKVYPMLDISRVIAKDNGFICKICKEQSIILKERQFCYAKAIEVATKLIEDEIKWLDEELRYSSSIMPTLVEQEIEDRIKELKKYLMI